MSVETGQSSLPPNRPARSQSAGPGRPDAVEARGVWRIVRLSRSLGRHAATWDDLNGRLFGHHPMLSSEFVDELLAHFGDGSEHLCILDSAGPGPASLGACIVKRQRPGLWATFRPPQAQVGCILLRGETSTNDLLRALPGQAAAIDLLCVDPAFSGALAQLHLRLRVHHALTMTVRTTGNFDDYWSGRPNKVRQNMRRLERRITTEGLEASHRILRSEPEIAAAVGRYCDLESEGWKGREGTALARDNGQGAFYLATMLRLARRGEAAVHELWLGERLAASRLVIQRGHSLVMLKTTYDESLATYGPGRLLLVRLLQDSFERHRDFAIEFYTDATRDQLAWATDWRAIRHVRVYRTALLAFAFQAARVLRALVRRTRPQAQGGAQVDVHDGHDALPPDVAALLEAAAAEKGMEHGADWYRMLAAHVLSDVHDIRYFVLRRDGSPVAVIPARLERPHGRRLHALSTYYTALYSPVIQPWLHAQDLLPLVQAMVSQCPAAAHFDFEPMDPESREFPLLRSALELSGLVPFRYFRFGNWFMQPNGIDWPSYLASRDGKVRSTVKRMSKKFTADGGRIEIVTGQDRLDAGIAAYEQVYAASWKQAEPHPDFIRALMRSCAERGWLRLGVAWLGDRPIAAQLWITSYQRAEIFKLSYDETYRAYSAGTLLTAGLMQQALDDDKVLEVDYLIGDDAYKRLWMDQRRERWGIVAYHPGRLYGVVGLLREVAGRALKALRAATRSKR